MGCAFGVEPARKVGKGIRCNPVIGFDYEVCERDAFRPFLRDDVKGGVVKPNGSARQIVRHQPMELPFYRGQKHLENFVAPLLSGADVNFIRNEGRDLRHQCVQCFGDDGGRHAADAEEDFSGGCHGLSFLVQSRIQPIHDKFLLVLWVEVPEQSFGGAISPRIHFKS